MYEYFVKEVKNVVDGDTIDVITRSSPTQVTFSNWSKINVACIKNGCSHCSPRTHLSLCY